jgi:hypothetical protein
MSLEMERYELRVLAHEENIKHLKEKLQLALDELSFHESMNAPIMAVEPEWNYEADESFGWLRQKGKIIGVKKQISDYHLEIKNNELALADLKESEEARSNKH